MTQPDIRRMYMQACLAELEALKPGNVHIFADGHGMQVQDFIKSAEASAIPICKPEYSVGERIFNAVNATWQAVGCNTNLGIILLCAPIIHTYLENSHSFTNHGLKQTLSKLSCDDARFAYSAIQIASPAGLGKLAEHDVNQPPKITLLEAMQVSVERDQIARQYCNGFAQVFEFGVNLHRKISLQWQREAWVNIAVYLSFLAHLTDSHISRKIGREAALAVQQEADRHYKIYIELENPKLYMPELLAFDQSLKSRGINPGTSADLTVATLLLVSLNKGLTA
jgi:triphosphoribosyl-dephospho-CoA synthase